jgi:hypothetical protein
MSDVGVKLLYMRYKLTYVDTLGLLKYIGGVELLLLSHVDREHGEKMEQHTIVE